MTPMIAFALGIGISIILWLLSSAESNRNAGKIDHKIETELNRAKLMLSYKDRDHDSKLIAMLEGRIKAYEDALQIVRKTR